MVKNINRLSSLLFFLSLFSLPASLLWAQDKRLVEVPISDAPSYAKRALVIGVTDYDVCPKLTVCGNDAKEFADLLKTKFGFSDVILMTDEPGTAGAMRPTQRNVKRALETLYNGLIPEKSEVVLFFSGHGTRARDLGGNDADWLIPNDGDAQDVPGTCLNYDAIKQRLATLRPARVLLVTDACRNLLGGGHKGLGGGSGFGASMKLRQMGSEVAELQSCQPTEESEEGLPGDFPESVFTHYLLKGLSGDPDAVDTGGLVTFDSLKQYVQGSVSGYVAGHFANASQVPDGRATLGRMVLARVAALPQLTPEQQKQANAQLVSLWIDDKGEANENKAKTITEATVQKTLNTGADVNATDKFGVTILAATALVGSVDVVRLLLDKGADVNAKCKDGRTPLLFASDHSVSVDVMHLLLNKGADVNAKDKYGYTALMNVAGHGLTEIVQLLLDKGADINVKNNVGLTPLMEASHYGYVDTVRLLLDKGAEVNAKDNAGSTALMAAAGMGHADIVTLLLDKKANVNAKDKYGYTALMNAATIGFVVDTTKRLLDRGADVNAKSDDGTTALSIATKSGSSAVAALLRAAGAKK